MLELLPIVLAVTTTSSLGPAPEPSPVLATQAPRGSQFVRTPKGEAEFVGLVTLTAEELMRRLAEHDKPKEPHLCAATLKKLGLADAAVSWTQGEGAGWTLVVLAVEDPSRVRYRPAPDEDGRELAAGWTPLLEAMKDMASFQFALLLYGERRARPDATDEEILAAGKSRFGMEIPETEIVAGWRILGSLSTPPDLELALWTLGHDRDPERRAAAACVLLNFAGDDRAWHAALDGQRDPHDSVTSACVQVLQTLAKSEPRNVDWAPAADSIRAVLDGTNPFAFLGSVNALVATEIAPELAAEVVPRGGGLLLDVARARDKMRSAAAIDLLRRLGGKPEAGPDELQAWVGTLHGK
jgi:hypothetical protein